MTLVEPRLLTVGLVGYWICTCVLEPRILKVSYDLNLYILAYKSTHVSSFGFWVILGLIKFWIPIKFHTEKNSLFLVWELNLPEIQNF